MNLLLISMKISEGVYEGIGAYDADSSEQIDASELH